jgi:hypothetical protein
MGIPIDEPVQAHDQVVEAAPLRAFVILIELHEIHCLLWRGSPKTEIPHFF